MDRVCSGFLGGSQHLVDHEITVARRSRADQHRPVGLDYMGGSAVGLRINCYCFQAERLAGPEHASCDFAAVGDKYAPDRARLAHASILATTLPSVTMSPSATRISRSLPLSGAATGISIFMDSRIRMASSSPSAAPTEATIFHTVPVISVFTSTIAIPAFPSEADLKKA